MIEYLSIGHICADLQPDGSTRLGGTALFAALTAYKLGLRTAILTACTPDFDLSSLPDDLPVLRQPSPATTIFENRYTPAGRTQMLHGRAATIDLSADALPASWRSPAIVHFAPIIQEIDPRGAPIFSGSLISATPQGWLRSVDTAGHVTTDPDDLLNVPWDGIRVAVMSEEDIQQRESLVEQLAQRVPLVVLTRAERGSTVFEHGRPTHVPAFPAEAIDPTGAGDVFTAAFLAALHQQHSPIEAARWASAAAACAIEGPGTSALPTPIDIQQRMQR